MYIFEWGFNEGLICHCFIKTGADYMYFPAPCFPYSTVETPQLDFKQLKRSQFIFPPQNAKILKSALTD